MNRELRETPAGTACRACGGTENIESHWCSAWLAPGGDPVLAVDHWEHWHKDCGCEFAALEQGE
jgi:hypothetical protein